jgi:mitochondrial fission protein ELM1
MAVLERLGHPYSAFKIKYNRGALLPNRLFGPRLWHIEYSAREVLAAVKPTIVITAGRRLAPAALWLKRQNQCFLCHLMRPDMPLQDFDLVAIPAHDDPHPAPNIMVTTGVAHRLTPLVLDTAKQKWKPLLQGLPTPRVAVMVGGDSKHGRFTAAHAAELGQSLAQAVAAARGSVMLSTSRRTSADATRALLHALGDTPRHQFLWGEAGDNPYRGYLAHADAIVVTEDSASMLWEALSVGKGVYIFHFGNNKRFAKFTKGLYDNGLARQWPCALTPFTTEPIDVAGQVAKAILQRFEDTIKPSAKIIRYNALNTTRAL